jgi:SAM-dependent methyltransferase
MSEASDSAKNSKEAESESGPPLWLAPEPDATPNFSQREFALREWMDEPTTFAAYRSAASSLERLNRWSMGHVFVQEFMAKVLERRKVTHEPLHIVDAGCGHGDTLRSINTWARKKSLPLRLTGIDSNPYSARLARERDRLEHVAAGKIAWVTGDLFSAKLEKPVDVVLSSLLAHHLRDDDVVRLLQWKHSQAQVAWMICDLVRSERAALWFARLARVLRLDAMVQHDGRISFRRALTVAEWKALVERAGVNAQVRDVGWGRVCITGSKG